MSRSFANGQEIGEVIYIKNLTTGARASAIASYYGPIHIA
jgi:hypothetical protein